MVNYRFSEIAERSHQALSKDGVLGRHVDPIFDDIEKGGIKYIDYAFNNHIPVTHKDQPKTFHRVGDKLEENFESFVDGMIATKEILGKTVSTHEAVCELGDLLNAHDEGGQRLDDETYENYAAVYDLLQEDLQVKLLVVYIAYRNMGRNHCAYRCQREMDEQTQRFATFIDRMRP